MSYYKAILEIGRKKKHERVMYIQRPTILEALDVTKKIRSSDLQRIEPISYEEYMKGVDKKYDKKKKKQNAEA